jgi:hypothetical protein
VGPGPRGGDRSRAPAPGLRALRPGGPVEHAPVRRAGAPITVALPLRLPAARRPAAATRSG